MLVHKKFNRQKLYRAYKDIDANVDLAKDLLLQFVESERLVRIAQLNKRMHQIVDSVQTLGVESLLQLSMQTEFWVDDVEQGEKFDKLVFDKVIGQSLEQIRLTIDLLVKGRAEPLPAIVELIDKIREQRNAPIVDVAKLFPIPIDVYPRARLVKELSEQEYADIVSRLRKDYQFNLLHWLREPKQLPIDRLKKIVKQLNEASALPESVRLWWVMLAYLDCVKYKSSAKETYLFRQIDDLLRDLALNGESVLERNSRDDLIRSMLFYIGSSSVRSNAIDEVTQAFKLNTYFPVKQPKTMNSIRSKITFLRIDNRLDMPKLKQEITQFFTDDYDQANIAAIKQKLHIVQQSGAKPLAKLSLLTTKIVDDIESQEIKRTEEALSQVSAAILFIEKSVAGETEIDDDWLDDCEYRLIGLHSVLKQHENFDKNKDINHERQALITVVTQEVHENIKEIEGKLEVFSQEKNNYSLLKGLDVKTHQIRGALHILNAHKISLLLQLIETQFSRIVEQKQPVKDRLLVALIVAIEAVNGYVNNLRDGHGNDAVLLERSIADLEIAIGEKVFKQDVEAILNKSSGSTFKWFDEVQANSEDGGVTNLHDQVKELAQQVSSLNADAGSSSNKEVSSNVFINNTRSNIALIRKQLDEPNRGEGESIIGAMQAVQKDARAVELDEMVQAYQVAEQFCHNGKGIFTLHQLQSINELLDLSSETLDSIEKKSILDKTPWKSIYQKLTDIHQDEDSNLELQIDDSMQDESSIGSDLDVNNQGGLIESLASIESLLVEQEIISLPSDTSDEKETIVERTKGFSEPSSVMINKVDALFESLDGIENLLVDNNDVDAKNEQPANHADLDDMEKSLTLFNNGKLELTDSVVRQSNGDNAWEKSAAGATGKKRPQTSILPDELTNLLEVDDLSSAVDMLEKVDKELQKRTDKNK